MSGESCLLGLKTDRFLLCLQVAFPPCAHGETERASTGAFSYKDTNPIQLFNLNYFLRNKSPNTATLGFRAST